MRSKRDRSSKQQLGQFMTPDVLATSLIASIDIKKYQKILEPSFGEGSFIFALIEKLCPSVYSSVDELFEYLYGVELDTELYNKFCAKIIDKYGKLPKVFNFFNSDFFDVEFSDIDLVIGNPPFGGTVSPDINKEDQLDNKYGKRHGLKIKKETYSFFCLKCIESLTPTGKLFFICSDTFLTVATHKGLRNYFMVEGFIDIKQLSYFSTETDYGMVWLNFNRGEQKDSVIINEISVSLKSIYSTPNLSYSTSDLIKYFNSDLLSKYLICSSGMTIGDNALFLKHNVDGKINEQYEYEVVLEPTTLDEEMYKSRTGKLSSGILKSISDQVPVKKLKVLGTEKIITLPHPDYFPYNKMGKESGVVVNPTTYIYWKDDGDAVKTFKRNGKWYLHGIGGEKFFKREGLTWNLISSKFEIKYLPEGFILDSGRPCAFLKSGVPKDEIYYIFAWLSSDLCRKILKEVINHTRNIQSKDIERLPYIVSPSKQEIIDKTKQLFSGLLEQKDYFIYINETFY